jgi:hypothetical protein
MIECYLVNMRQKLITLCPTTMELAMKKPNFSYWVREQLLKETRKNKKMWEDEWERPHKEYVIKNNEVEE